MRTPHPASRLCVLLALALATAAGACTSSSANCVPDGQPACECTPDEARPCADNTGAPGVQYCASTGRWSTCLPYSPDGPTQDATMPSNIDVLIPDFGGPGG
jgi:hypothetical protein